MKALIIVDLQKDFCPGGALAVAGGNDIIPVINALQRYFQMVVATKDWHPRNHISFASRHHRPVGSQMVLNCGEQMLWPDHCVQGSEGAEFSSFLNQNYVTHIVHKGTCAEVDSYSGFFDNERNLSTGLDVLLRGSFVHQVIIAGLAADFCVKYTALDAVSLGFRTTVVSDATCAVFDKQAAFQEMQRKGVLIRESKEIISSF